MARRALPSQRTALSELSKRKATELSTITPLPSLSLSGLHTLLLLSGTIFEKSQQALSTLVLLIRGIAKGESSSQLSRELNMSRKQVGTIRRVIQDNLLAALPREPMIGGTFEADEIYQNAGEKR